MQVDIKQLTAVLKEITLIIEPERTMKMYQKYLNKAGKEVAVPGFRKGKAPLSMVERMYADRIMDLFYKEMVDDCFDEAAKEHDIHYLLYPEVKDIEWQKNEAMTIKIEIETEPEIEFKQLEGLQIPYKPLIIEEEVDKFIEGLLKENSYLIEIEEEAIEKDVVDCELSYNRNEETITAIATITADATKPDNVYSLVIGKNIGDHFECNIAGIDLATLVADNTVDMDTDIACKLIVNAIQRQQIPELNDDFAKDMEFDDLTAMRAKINDDMKLMIEHKNISLQNSAIVAKLYIDNRFDLPERTLTHIAAKETENIPNQQWKAYYEYQVKMQIAQEMIHIYTMNNLKKVYQLEVSDEDKQNYIIHNAILEEKTAEAWGEQNKDFITKEDFTEAVKNFMILQMLATKNEFIDAPEPQEHEHHHEMDMDDTISEAELVSESDASETQADLFSELTEEK